MQEYTSKLLYKSERINVTGNKRKQSKRNITKQKKKNKATRRRSRSKDCDLCSQRKQRRPTAVQSSCDLLSRRLNSFNVVDNSTVCFELSRIAKHGSKLCRK